MEDDINIQYERLKRHYNLCLKDKNDVVGFLDLSHTLRVWLELKGHIDYCAKQSGFRFEFKNSTGVNGKLKRVLEDVNFVHIPNPVEVPGQNLQLRDVIIIKGKALTPEEIKEMFHAGRSGAKKVTLSISEWLGSEICRCRLEGADQAIPISRDTLIRRVANLFGGSHSAGSSEKEEEGNRFDPLVRELHRNEIDGQKATYYVLLESAGQILEQCKVVLKD